MAITRRQRLEEGYEREAYAERREQILREASPALRQKLEWIDAWFVRKTRRAIQARYDLAEQIQEVYDDANEANGRRYGANAIEVIQDYCRWGRSAIYEALHFASAFTPQEVEAASELRMPGGEPVSYGHLRSLIAVEDPGRRQELLGRAVSEGWTCQRLAREAYQAGPKTGKKADKRGRPYAAPKDFDGVLHQQLDFAEDFLDRATQVWEHTERSLAARAGELPESEVTPERVAEAGKLAVRMSAVAAKARRLADEAESVRARLAETLHQREQGTRRVRAGD